MKLNISKIQHFSTGDGKGIRTTVFFKGCNLSCPWCHNPENLSFSQCLLTYKDGKTELCGRQVDIDEILPELLEDKDFYDASEGGVTLSGGECMLQAEGVRTLSQKLSEHKVSVLVDTAGCVPYKNFETVNPHISGYLFDFKTADADKYENIGGDLELVSENLSRLILDGINVNLRIPLIPDFNTDERSIFNICTHLTKIGIKQAGLLPFHRLGSAKYEALSKSYSYKDTPPLSLQTLESIKSQYSQYLKITIEG